MNIFFKEHHEILAALLKHRVNFMLIGGYAVNYYGYHRTTGDMDIWLEPSNENKEMLLQAFTALGFDDEGIHTIRNWDFTKPQKFHIGSNSQPDKTDFLTHISGVAFPNSFAQKTLADIDGFSLPVIHYNSLIQNKKSSGSTKDLADVEYLEKIILLKNKIK